MAVALDNVRLLQEETDSKNATLTIELDSLNEIVEQNTMALSELEKQLMVKDDLIKEQSSIIQDLKSHLAYIDIH